MTLGQNTKNWHWMYCSAWKPGPVENILLLRDDILLSIIYEQVLLKAWFSSSKLINQEPWPRLNLLAEENPDLDKSSKHVQKSAKKFDSKFLDISKRFQIAVCPKQATEGTIAERTILLRRWTTSEVTRSISEAHHRTFLNYKHFLEWSSWHVAIIGSYFSSIPVI